ncbi:MAG: MarR family transcriptional regulator [Propionibacteriales bacterium]|nr:MarR family transcriptional regulator [Propionibacteriales bacterium]
MPRRGSSGQDQAVELYRLLMADVYELAGTSRASSEGLASGYGQTAARWHVLSVVSEESLSVAAAARRLGLARQSVQRVVNALRADGLVTLSPDPTDMRAPLVALSDRGRTTLTRLQSASARSRTGVLAASGLSNGQLEQARETARALVAALRRAEDP